MIRRALTTLLAGFTLLAGTAVVPAAAHAPSALKPLCGAAGHGCGKTVDYPDAKIIGRHFGHNIGSVLNGADVDRILDRARKVRAAQESQVRRASVWDRLAECESSGRWNLNVGLYDGGLQFHPSTWTAYKLPGYPPYAYQATRGQQIAAAERVLDAQGWGAWPACSRKLGLR